MKALYTAATGMTAQQTRIDNIANNLANVNTTAYKKSRHTFQDLMYEELNTQAAAGAEVRASAELGSGVELSGIVKNHGQGSAIATGGQLDFSINGSGYFKIETADGTPLYTRDGSFKTDDSGNLVTASGLFVAGGTNLPSGATVSVSEDGTVMNPNTEEVYGTIEVVDFTNAAGLASVGGNLYEATAMSGDEVVVQLSSDGTSISQGELEGSNVDVAEELIEMIMAQRAYELTSKVVQAADETLQIAANLRR